MHIVPAIVFMVVCLGIGFGAHILWERIRGRREFNEFAAYSDEELRSQRKNVASRVRYRRAHGYTHILRKPLRELKRLDGEIQRRDRQKAIEAGRKTDFEAFDYVFDRLMTELPSPTKGEK